MPTCQKCGEEATILYREKWWCTDHFRMEREEQESGTGTGKEIQKLPGYNAPTQTKVGKEELEQVFDETGVKAI